MFGFKWKFNFKVKIWVFKVEIFGFKWKFLYLWAWNLGFKDKFLEILVLKVKMLGFMWKLSYFWGWNWGFKVKLKKKRLMMIKYDYYLLKDLLDRRRQERRRQEGRRQERQRNGGRAACSWDCASTCSDRCNRRRDVCWAAAGGTCSCGSPVTGRLRALTLTQGRHGRWRCPSGAESCAAGGAQLRRPARAAASRPRWRSRRPLSASRPYIPNNTFYYHYLLLLLLLLFIGI